MTLPEIAVKRPVTVFMVIVAVLALGSVSLFRIPLELFPDVSWPSMGVSAPYSSSSPEEVEERITRPLEEHLGTVRHLKRLTATSGGFGSNMRLEFEWGTDMDQAALEVREKIEHAYDDLPDDMGRISIRRWLTTDRPVVHINVSWEGREAALEDIVEKNIKRRLERIDGVANVDVRGLRERRLTIELDRDKMRAYDIDAYRLRQAIAGNNLTVSGGEITEGGKKYLLRVDGEMRSAEDVAATLIKTKGITIGDIADVRIGYPERERYRRLDGKEAVSLSVYKSSTANLVAVAGGVREEMERLSGESGMSNLRYYIYRDRSEDILKSLFNLRNVGIYGGILAFLVLFFFVRDIRSTLIVFMAIPISIVSTCALMYLSRVFLSSSITINIVSLTGLMMAVGMLVDNSVVVLESIYRRKEEGGCSSTEAALEGSRDIAVAVFAATFTTIVVFSSLVFGGGTGMGIWLKDFGFVVSASLLASLLVSLTLIPVVASKAFKGAILKGGGPSRFLETWYQRTIRGTLRWRKTVLLGSLLLVAASFFLLSKIDRRRAPRAPERRVDVRVNMPSAYSIEDMAALFDKVEKIFLEKKEELEIETIESDFGIRRRREWDPRGEISFYLKEAKKGGMETVEIRREILSAMPVIPGVVFERERSRWHGGSGEIEVEVRGEDTEILEMIAGEVKDVMLSDPGVNDVSIDRETGEEELIITLDRTRVMKSGVSTFHIARSVNAALSERAVSRLRSGKDEIEIYLTLREEDRVGLEDLKNLSIEGGDEALVPLGTLAKFTLMPGQGDRRRVSRLPLLEVTGETEGRGTWFVTRNVQEKLAGLSVPPGYSLEMGEEHRRFREGRIASRFALTVALLLIYLVMAALFESPIHPLTIFSSILFALIGVSLVFYATGTPLDDMSTLGLLVLCGIVVNNGIILVDVINRYRREKGMAIDKAIIEGGRVRLRPILITAITTLGGLTPMVAPIFFPGLFGPVEGRSQMWSPVGLALFGGLTTSTFLTLLLTPVIYRTIEDVRDWVVRVLAYGRR